MHKRLNTLLAGSLLASTPFAALADSWKGEWETAAELRHFNHESSQPQQDDLTTSLLLEGEITNEWLGGNLRATIKPFLRADSADSERSHVDLREANLLWLQGNWEVLAGVGKTFWGALESAHLVDIINQTDAVENIDGEDKLGQPMVRVTRYLPFGAVEGYVMSGFRDRTFSGVGGRFRAEIPVDTNNPEFEASEGRDKVEYALRFSGSLGSLDYGIGYFNGTSRDPRLLLNPVFDGMGNPVGATLTPFYEEIGQTSVDALWAVGGWLLKAEAYYREDSQEEFLAGGAGAEYTFVGVLGNTDLGVLAEYLYDNRDTQLALYQRDLFTALRWVRNDQAGTEVLAGLVRDLDDNSQLGLIEASRRLGERAEMALEIRWLTGFGNNQALSFIDKDDYAQFELRWYF